MTKEQIIGSIHGATVGVFSTMLGLEIEPGEVVNATACPKVQEGVMSFVGMDGVWVGTGVLTCSAELACKLSAAFLMTEAPSVNEDVLDCIGELTNMIIGNFKTDAEQALGPMTLGVPTVIYGRNFMSRSLGGNEWMIMPFKCGEDSFEVQIQFKPAAESGTNIRHINHLTTA